jgi:uncharacterized membrane protein
MNPAARSQRFAPILIAALAVAGLGINLFLLTRTMGDASIAGCGGGPCNELLASRWSSLLGVPLTLFGALAWLGLLASFTNRLKVLRPPLLGAITGAAFWLIIVQAVILRKFCPWCMAAHGLGLSIVALEITRGTPGTFRHVAGWAVAALIGLASMQALGPAPAGHRIESTGTTPPAVRSNAPPQLGPPDAEHVIVEYFDYQCATCRKMAAYIETLVANHSGRVAVLLMPVPLEDSCNPHLGPSNKPHPGSCAIARTALAVWRVRPDAFAVFHKQLIADPSEPSATRLARELMTEEQLQSALADPWIDSTIQSNIATWRTLSKSNDKLPKLIIRDKRVLHGLPPGEEEFLRVVKSELGL